MRVFSAFRLNDRMPQNRFNADAGHPNCLSQYPPTTQLQQQQQRIETMELKLIDSHFWPVFDSSDLNVLRCEWLEWDKGIGGLNGFDRFPIQAVQTHSE